MALSSRAQAFSVEALMGRPSKRKSQDSREEMQPELQEEQCVQKEEEEEEVPSSTSGDSEPREKRLKAESSKTVFSSCSGGESIGQESRHEKNIIQVELQGSDLWKRFHDIGTEMIITKAGRRMFPSVRIKVKGLDPAKQYYVIMDVVPVDSKRYRYVYHSSQWMVAGNTDHSSITPRFYVHPDSPCSGETWMLQIISFDRVKLTNNEMDDKGHIILQSMHKYKPRVHVMEQDSRIDLSLIQSLPTEGVKTFSFKETEFTTVTAYQNQQITKLKIDRNPFAKGFRDPGRNRSVLDGFLETYPWRPSFTVDFKTFVADTQSGSSGSSPVTSSGGAPSPSNTLLSPSCSPPTPSLHIPPSSFGRTYPETYLHNVNLPFCYKICPTNVWRPQPLVLPTPERLPSFSSSQVLPPLKMEMPMVSSRGIINSNRGIINSNSGLREDCNGQCLQASHSANQVLYGLQNPGNIFQQNPIAQETLSCPFHPSYGCYRYNISMPSRRENATNHLNENDNSQTSFKEGRCDHSNWYPAVNHCL
ncbi:T-box transcription factor TBX22 [Mesocricetus auratus]|uniref:T-box transcription factor TBX22 n=1 Tax=Mesocricetus auratus TaxID=10036 RepID=A0A1U7R2A5_MESAU|nr:T-box transcription factor TBX22 [Mesocricetus auratus]